MGKSSRSTVAVAHAFSTARFFVWNRRQAEVCVEQGVVQHKISEIEKRQQVLLDKLIAGTITDDAFKKKDAELTAERTVLRSQLNDTKLDELEVEAVLNAAEYVLCSPNASG